MDNAYFPALQWLINEHSITNLKDYELAAKAIVAASKKISGLLSGISGE